MEKSVRNGIIIGGVVCLGIGAIVGTGYGLAKRNENAKSPLGWCVEEIKRKDLFAENQVQYYAFTGEKTQHKLNDDKDFQPVYDTESYFVEIVYMTYDAETYEKWFCSISYGRTIWAYLTKDQVNDVQCSLMARNEL